MAQWTPHTQGSFPTAAPIARCKQRPQAVVCAAFAQFAPASLTMSSSQRVHGLPTSRVGKHLTHGFHVSSRVFHWLSCCLAVVPANFHFRSLYSSIQHRALAAAAISSHLLVARCMKSPNSSFSCLRHGSIHLSIRRRFVWSCRSASAVKVQAAQPYTATAVTTASKSLSSSSIS